MELVAALLVSVVLPCVGVALWFICGGAAYAIEIHGMSKEKRDEMNEGGGGCLIVLLGPIGLCIMLGEWIATRCLNRGKDETEEEPTDVALQEE